MIGFILSLASRFFFVSVTLVISEDGNEWKLEEALNLSAPKADRSARLDEETEAELLDRIEFLLGDPDTFDPVGQLQRIGHQTVNLQNTDYPNGTFFITRNNLDVSVTAFEYYA